MTKHANEIAWWMAYCGVIASMRHTLLDDFLQRPPCGAVADLASAESHIVGASRYRTAPSNHWQLTQKGHVATQFQDAHQRYSAALANGKWCPTYSGNEIFRDLATGSTRIFRRGPHAMHRVNLASINMSSTRGNHFPCAVKVNMNVFVPAQCLCSC